MSMAASGLSPRDQVPTGRIGLRLASWYGAVFVARSLAIVDEKAWEKGMSVFYRPVTTAKIRYFDRAAADEACAWLGAA